MNFSNIMDSNSYVAGGTTDAAAAEIIESRERLLGPAYRLFYDNPVHLIRGKGTRLFAADGTEYLDAFNNVPCIGHANSHVVDAISRQLGELNTHSRYLHDAIVQYSERLLATMGESISQIMYACTGSEANDLALRIAASYTGGSGVIVTSDAYHGNTAAVSAISPSLGAAGNPPPHVRHVAAPNPLSTPKEQLAAQFAADVAAAITDLDSHGIKPNALVIDTIFSSDGIYPEPDVLGPAVQLVHNAGGVFIADEVQPGFARTGHTMWGFERHHVRPDLVTVGKPMGNGFPISAVATRPDVLAPFARNTPYFNTFGGNPVAMAAAGAVLDVIESENLGAHADSMGNQIHAALADLQPNNPLIADIRGAGLYLGIELKAPDGSEETARNLTRNLINDMRARRVLMSMTGAAGNVIKIRPPLVFDQDDLQWLLSELTEALTELARA